MPPSFWQRNRRRILLATLVVGGSAAVAYYAYTKWRQMADDFNAYLESILADEAGAQRKSSGASRRVRRPPPDAAARGPLDRITERSREGCDSSLHTHVDASDDERHDDADGEEERRSEHFQSIQKISDGTTVPSLVPHLRARLYHLDGVDLWAEQLRARRPAAGSPPQQNSPTTSGRDSLWSSLVQASFARAVAACWSLPLLQLFVKVQLTLLGRHLFLESQDSEGQLQPRDARGGTARTHSRDSSTQSFSRLLPSRLTLRCQQKFLSYAEFLAQRGLEAVVEEALTVSQSVLGDVDLRRPCTEATLRGMLARMQAEFEASAACKGWGRLLLPKIGSGGPDGSGEASPTAPWQLLTAQAATAGLSSSVDGVLDEGDLQVLAALLNETHPAPLPNTTQ